MKIKYKDIKASELFEVLKGRNKLSKSNIDENGTTPLYSSTEENNGIIGYTNNAPDYTISDENPFYIIFGDHTKSMYIATNSFCVMDNVKVLIPKIYNKYVVRYILTVWRKKIPNLGYSRHWNVAQKSTIKLPIDFEGNLNFHYMENYMRDIEKKVIDSISNLEKINNIERKKININDWSEFVVGDLFEIKPTKSYKLKNAELMDGGASPVVVNSAYNNGIGGSSSKPTTELGNIITFSDTVDANTIFYQEDPFIGYSHVQGLYPTGKYKNKWCKESFMFFASCFRKLALTKGFDYGNKFRRDIAINLKVKLPIDSNGDPDWIYMENYMFNLEKKVKESLCGLNSTNT